MTPSRRPIDVGALLSAGLSILYPVLVVSSVHLLGPYPTIVLACVLLAAGIARPSAMMPIDLLWVPLVAVATVAAIGLYDAELGVRIYPVAVNMAMLWAFARSLWRPPSMIERFARVVEPDLDARGVRYTRKVTVIWIGFFAINGSIALWTAVAGSWLQWTLYNGAISYILAGLLFASEYLVRQRVRRQGTA
ncbi:MAG: hypothetical protein AAF637_01010 [Pseudomonadota bacterium]